MTDVVMNEKHEDVEKHENVLTKEQENALFYRVPINETESEHLAAEPYSYWKSVFRIFIKVTKLKYNKKKKLHV